MHAENPARTPRPHANTRPGVRIAAVIFDFDETLIDLESQHTSAYHALTKALGSDYDSMPESFRTGSGRRVIDDLREMRAFFGWSASDGELLALRNRHFSEACRTGELRLMPGAEAMIRELARRGVPMAIASSAVGSDIDAILRRFALRDFFNAIVDGASVARGKPDPEAYVQAASRVGVAPASCLVFEDSNVGVRAARAAGAFCIAVRNPHAKSRQDLSMAHLEVGSLEDVVLDDLLGTGD